MQKTTRKSIAAAAIVTAFAVVASPFSYALVEPTAVFAVTDEVVITLVVDSAITISSPANSSMSQQLGIVGNSATASTTWNVKTSDTDGYTLAVQASTDPAMSSGVDDIADYTPAVAATPETWSVSSGNAEFGYSAYGARVSTGTWGTDSDCIAGDAHTPSAGLKYVDFTTSAVTIGTYNATTSTAGDDATVCYAVEQDGVYIPSGTYTATITATALVQ